MLNTQNRSWQPMLTSSQAARAADVALKVATRLRECDEIEAAVLATKRQTAYPQAVFWQPYGVAQGYAGLAIMCGYLAACFPNEEWDLTGHRHLELAARAAEQQSFLPAGMFSGLSGLAFATWSLSLEGKRYLKLLTAIEQQLFPQVIALARDLSGQTSNISVSQFDLIYGLSGVGAYLLCRKETLEAVNALRAVLTALVELIRGDADLPRWYTPVHLLGDETMMSLYPHGNLNCGLAHGIPGPLGLLSLACLSGITVNGLEDALRQVVTWLLRHRMDDQWGINWPTVVRVQANGTVSTETAAPFEPSRTAWCYGSPGLARALWLAGEALGDSDYRAVAISAMEAVYRRPLEVRQIDSPTFCHGIAGLLQITLRFAHDTGLPQFTEAAKVLGEQLLSLYDPDSLLGYYSLEPGGNRVDQPGLLDGVPGVVLVLLAAATDLEPDWDRLFLLS